MFATTKARDIALEKGPGKARRGASAAELAFTLPVLLLVVLGCVDFGRFAYTYLTVTNAARAGAGEGAMSAYPVSPTSKATWRAAVRATVEEEMGGLSGFDPAQLVFTAEADTSGETLSLWRARVEVSYPFQTLVNWPGVPSAVTVSRRVVLRGIR